MKFANVSVFTTMQCSIFNIVTLDFFCKFNILFNTYTIYFIAFLFVFHEIDILIIVKLIFRM